jgi:hypothetical protein
MSDQQGSSTPAAGNRTIEIRYERSNFFLGIMISVMMIAGGIAWAILDPSERPIFVAISGFVVLIGVILRAHVA